MMNTSKPKFPLGQLVATANAASTLSNAEVLAGIARHAVGDWGEVCEEDRAANEEGLAEGLRLFSVYRTPTDTTFWIITEWDRSMTTVLLPEDY